MKRISGSGAWRAGGRWSSRWAVRRTAAAWCGSWPGSAAVGSSGDGYRGSPLDTGTDNPHTAREELRGVTVGKLALLVLYGLLDWRELEAVLGQAERVQQHTQTELAAPPLYPAYTQLVCRTARPAPRPATASEWSHALHADNCQLRGAHCDRTGPAFPYSYRTHSAILYLNSDFHGGQLVFAAPGPTGHLEETSSLEPGCGRLVVFTAGEENIHGVRAVEAGERCVLAAWYTTDQQYEEPELALAHQVVRVSMAGAAPPPHLQAELERLTLYTMAEAETVLRENTSSDGIPAK